MANKNTFVLIKILIVIIKHLLYCRLLEFRYSLALKTMQILIIPTKYFVRKTVSGELFFKAQSKN